MKPFGGHIPQIGDREQAAKAMIAQQVGQLSSAIYARAVGNRLQHPGPQRPASDWEQLARDSHAAAKAYFEALGIAEFE